MMAGNAARFGRDVLESLNAHTGRYALAAFAVTVGVMAFALLVLIVGGLETQVEEITGEFGADVLSVEREDPLEGSVRGLSVGHADVISANYPGWRVAPMRRYRSRALGSDQPVDIIATSPELAGIRNWRILEGRNLDTRDVEEKARVIVASRRLRDIEGWQVGRIVYVDDEPFFVAGVLDADAARLGDESIGARFALIPWSTAPSWQGERRDIGHRVERILVQGDGDVDDTLAAARGLITQPEMDAGSLGWVTVGKLVAGIERLQRTVGLSVGAISLLCLLLGGTTLMSLMVLNVRERIPEIGLRLSLGARRKQVSALFVVEALVVTVFAGVTGTMLAHLLAGYLEGRLPVPLTPGWSSVLAPTFVAVLIGTIFSWWPARLAARTTPSEAIRAD